MVLNMDSHMMAYFITWYGPKCKQDVYKFQQRWWNMWKLVLENLPKRLHMTKLKSCGEDYKLLHVAHARHISLILRKSMFKYWKIYHTRLNNSIKIIMYICFKYYLLFTIIITSDMDFSILLRSFFILSSFLLLSSTSSSLFRNSLVNSFTLDWVFNSLHKTEEYLKALLFCHYIFQY